MVPNLSRKEFESFLQAHGVEHCRATPLWPQANGKVERQNCLLLNSHLGDFVLLLRS